MTKLYPPSEAFQPWGGVLLGFRDERHEGQPVVRDAIIDVEVEGIEDHYTINYQYLNSVVRKKKEEKGLEIMGMAISYPRKVKRHPRINLNYFSMYFTTTKMDNIIIPLIHPSDDKDKYQFINYVMERKGHKVSCVEYSVIKEDNLAPFKAPTE